MIISAFTISQHQHSLGNLRAAKKGVICTSVRWELTPRQLPRRVIWRNPEVQKTSLLRILKCSVGVRLPSWGIPSLVISRDAGMDLINNQPAQCSTWKWYLKQKPKVCANQGDREERIEVQHKSTYRGGVGRGDSIPSWQQGSSIRMWTRWGAKPEKTSHLANFINIKGLSQLKIQRLKIAVKLGTLAPW